MDLLFLEPFFGGSHKQFAEGLIKNSSHKIDILTMPDCNWNWRIRGSALYFSKCIDNIEKYDGIITTNLMRLSDFKTFVGGALPPVMVYFHENQLTYPLAPKGKRDAHLCMNDIATALSANRIIFNSKFHMNSFFKAIAAFLENLPDYSPDWILGEIIAKANFIYPGCDFQLFTGTGKDDFIKTKNEPPLIIWNHRWSYDKNAASFFYALSAVKSKGIAFRLALLGENSGMIPDAFVKAKETFKEQIVCYGYAKDRATYIEWLKKGDIVVSTAIQENFGIAVVEAIRYGCMPLLPARLSYPEILPETYHCDFLYHNQKSFIAKLIMMIAKPDLYINKFNGLAESINNYTWEKLIDLYDNEITKMVNRLQSGVLN